MDTYEKKYNEALKWMRELYPGLHGATKEDAEHFFPELCESEDERIRKWLYDYIINCPNNNFAFYGGVGKDAVLNYLEKQKEQKPAEKQDYSGLNDPERAILRGFLCAGFENVPIGIIKDTASECMGFLALIEPKQEWSEEDEKQLDDIISIIRGAYEHGITISETRHRNAYSWLNNLRPSWKPSEEQMEALMNGLRILPAGENNDILLSLYNDLKKL